MHADAYIRLYTGVYIALDTSMLSIQFSFMGVQKARLMRKKCPIRREIAKKFASDARILGHGHD
jgi:hypothetical protein